MKNIKAGYLLKPVAFFVIATILTCTVAFAAGGWHSFIESPESDDAAGNGQSGNVDENKDGNGSTPLPVIPPEPKYYHYLTGLEISKNDLSKRPLAFVYSSSDPTYAISSSLLTVEIPIENGDTRYVAFLDGSDYLGKIGSIAPTRDYISSVVSSLGSTLIYSGNDDSFSYSQKSYTSGLDLTVHTGYSYTEYSKYNYSNGDLINALIKNTGTVTTPTDSVITPFAFTGIDSTLVSGKSGADSITIPYSERNTTSFVFDRSIGAYTLYKGTAALKDLLNDKSCTYTNVFVLYANATTYETEDAVETVIDTTSGGVGYYFTCGTVMEIEWRLDGGGNLIFFDDTGAKLTVNRGTSYIAFERASQRKYITYN